MRRILMPAAESQNAKRSYSIRDRVVVPWPLRRQRMIFKCHLPVLRAIAVSDGGAQPFLSHVAGRPMLLSLPGALVASVFRRIVPNAKSSDDARRRFAPLALHRDPRGNASAF